MKKFYIKFLLTVLLLGLIPCTNFCVNANSDLDVEGLEIAHELTPAEVEHTNRWIRLLGSSGGNLWLNYHKAHEDLNLWERLFSGILEVDDIMNYMVYVVRFLSQLGLLVGAGFIMFAGYKYMFSVFTGGKTASSILKNAIIGVIIVIFSYAIMRILTSIIGLT